METGALTLLRDGDIPGALDTYLAHQRVHISPDHQQLQDVVADDYLTWRDRLPDTSGPGGVLVVAATRRHTAQINQRIPERLTTRGDLTGPQLDAGTLNDPLPLRSGDLVLVVANDHHRGLLNGEHACVISIDPTRGELVLATPDQRQLTVPAAWAGAHLGHGYALTCHKAQGQTVDVTLVAGSAALTRETIYTALSRGRSNNHLYLAPDTPLDPTTTPPKRGSTTTPSPTPADTCRPSGAKPSPPTSPPPGVRRPRRPTPLPPTAHPPSASEQTVTTTTTENEMTQHPHPSDAHPAQRPPIPSDLLNITEAAEHLGTPVRFIRRLIAERRIPFYKIGRYVRIDAADPDHFIQEGRIERKRYWAPLHESAWVADRGFQPRGAPQSNSAEPILSAASRCIVGVTWL